MRAFWLWRKDLLRVALVLAAGCAVESGKQPVGLVAQALSPCEEMVPEDRFIDGIPAYAQCDASRNSAIYSNNGVDTSTTSLGPDWVRTQYSGGYQCTELANRYLTFVWDIDWRPRGNAGSWCDTVPPGDSGVEQTPAPVHGDLMVLAPGSCGADSSTGHVAVVDLVQADGRLSVVEQNGARRGSYQPSCGRCFLHVIANDGSVGAAGAGGMGPPPAGTGGVGAATGGTDQPPVPAAPEPPAPPPAPAPAPAPGPAPAPAPVPAAPAPTPAPVPAAGATPATAPIATFPALPERDRRTETEVGCSVSNGTRGGGSGLALPALLLLGSWLRRRSR